MDVRILPVIVAAVALAIVIASSAAPKVERAAQTAHSLLNEIQDAADKVCDVDTVYEILDRVRRVFGDDPQIQEIFDQIDSGRVWPECGLAQIYKYLGEENRKRIGSLELICDASHCLQAASSGSKP